LAGFLLATLACEDDGPQAICLDEEPFIMCASELESEPDLHVPLRAELTPDKFVLAFETELDGETSSWRVNYDVEDFEIAPAPEYGCGE
jgi:hypothetical protein